MRCEWIVIVKWFEFMLFDSNFFYCFCCVVRFSQQYSMIIPNLPSKDMEFVYVNQSKTFLIEWFTNCCLVNKCFGNDWWSIYCPGTTNTFGGRNSVFFRNVHWTWTIGKRKAMTMFLFKMLSLISLIHWRCGWVLLLHLVRCQTAT